jgi:hypothetical protein
VGNDKFDNYPLCGQWCEPTLEFSVTPSDLLWSPDLKPGYNINENTFRIYLDSDQDWQIHLTTNSADGRMYSENSPQPLSHRLQYDHPINGWCDVAPDHDINSPSTHYEETIALRQYVEWTDVPAEGYHITLEFTATPRY